MKKINEIDYIKVIASFSVSAVHFRNRLESTIASETINNAHKLFFSLNYSIFVIAVPLFLLVSGFLLTNSRPSIKYIWRSIDTYLMYFFMAMISFSLMVLLNARQPIGFLTMIHRASQFDLISGWYIEMYVGLILLVPFLSKLYSMLSSNEKKLLIISLLLIIAIPSGLNVFPKLRNYFAFPQYWKSMYPLLYVVMGFEIRRLYDNGSIRITNKLYVIYILSVALITFLLYWNANPYTKTSDGYYPSIFQVVMSVSLFMILLNKFKGKSSKLMYFLSKYTLSTYIMSYPVDKVLYPYLIQLVESPDHLIKYFVPIVIASFTLSFLSGYVLFKIYNFIKKLTIEIYTLVVKK